MKINEIVKTASAIRLRQRLRPEGGDGDKIFPPTFAGGVYCWEDRCIDGKRRPCVLLDSVASQANRFEEALLALTTRGEIELPRLSVEFSGELADIGAVDTLTAPHRIFDAILRDSETADGKPFFKSELYRGLTECNVRNATALLAHAPSALLFGCWDSTGAAGGLGNKFARSLTSEIIGVDAVWGTTQGGVRQDPLGIRADVEITIDKDGDWSVVGKSASAKKDRAKGTRPSEINHGNILVSVESATRETVAEDGTIQTIRQPLRGGVTVAYALQTSVLSLTALRRLKFPVSSGKNADDAARVLLAALGLVAITAGRERGYWLRSRCGLVADGLQDLEVVNADGSTSSLSLDSKGAMEIYRNAIANARECGLPWNPEPVRLVPQKKLVDLIKASRERLALGG